MRRDFDYDTAIAWELLRSVYFDQNQQQDKAALCHALADNYKQLRLEAVIEAGYQT